MKTIKIVLVAVVATLALAACSSGGGDTDTTEPAGGTTTTEPTETETTDPAGGSTELTITAPAGSANSGFAETELSVPADTPFTIVFKNDDPGIPHNVQIFEGTDTAAPPVFAPEGGELINGVAETTYEVPALEAGTYTYNCLAHPATMVGTLTVG
jgi:plastocyanin